MKTLTGKFIMWFGGLIEDIGAKVNRIGIKIWYWGDSLCLSKSSK